MARGTSPDIRHLPETQRAPENDGCAGAAERPRWSDSFRKEGTEKMWPTLLTAWAIVFAMNAVPLHLPPAWMVMGAVYATSGVLLLPLTVGGSAASALGRLGFSRTVSRLG